MAVFSLVTGILGWTALLFVGGSIAAWAREKAKQEIRDSGGQITGDGLATAGIALGYANLALGMLICIIMGGGIVSNFL